MRPDAAVTRSGRRRPAADRATGGASIANKTRLDVLLTQRGLAESRNRAQALIRAGEVMVDGQRHDKPGMSVRDDAQITVRERMPWVGRGGLKLDAVLDRLDVEVNDRRCLDVGASTGGFTDVLLERGAAHVVAVDVGTGQLDWRLRQDERVTSMERTDIRHVEALDWPIDLATVDVSFISVTKVLAAVERLVTPAAPVLALVKPQFEAGRADVGRGGIVRDASIHAEVLRRVHRWARAKGWLTVDIVPAAVTGSAGNQEFFMFLTAPAAQPGVDPAAAPEIRAPTDDRDIETMIEHALREAAGDTSS